MTPAGTPVSTLSQVPAVPGDTVVTSIDARVQRIAEQAIADAVTAARTTPQHISGKNQTQKADAAAAVVIDTRTGHVIAAANYPSYDPGVWDGGTINDAIYKSLQANPGKPLFSQAIQGQYAPGSTFKVVTTAAALDHGGYTPDATYDCPGTLTEGGRTFHNFDNEGAQGMITFAQALTISCDTFFDGVGAALWNADGQLAGANARELVVNEAKQWKLGKDTGIDLPIDASGNIESRQDLKNYDAKNHALWCSEAKTDKDPNQKAIDNSNCLYHIPALYQIGEAVNVAIGQGTTTASPLQMADIYAALGNGGTLYSPRLVKAIVGPDGKLVQTIDAPSTKLSVSPEVLQYIQQALVGVVTDPNGTGAAAFAGFPFDQYTIAGKTGTAEVPPKDDTAWFASYGGPAGQPAQYAVVVAISQGGQGGVSAAPAVRQIYDGIWGLNGNPKNPDDQFAAKGPALPGGAPPSALPKVVQAAGPSATPGSADSGLGDLGLPDIGLPDIRLAVNNLTDSKLTDSTRTGAGAGRRCHDSAGATAGGEATMIGDWAAPRPRRMGSSRAGMLTRESRLRRSDWVLTAAVLSLSLIGVLLVAAATRHLNPTHPYRRCRAPGAVPRRCPRTRGDCNPRGLSGDSVVCSSHLRARLPRPARYVRHRIERGRRESMDQHRRRARDPAVGVRQARRHRAGGDAVQFGA